MRHLLTPESNPDWDDYDADDFASVHPGDADRSEVGTERPLDDDDDGASYPLAQRDHDAESVGDGHESRKSDRGRGGGRAEDGVGSGAVRKTGSTTFPTIVIRTPHSEDAKRWRRLITELPEALPLAAAACTSPDRDAAAKYNATIANLSLAVSRVQAPFTRHDGAVELRSLCSVVGPGVVRTLIASGVRRMSDVAVHLERRNGHPHPGAWMMSVLSAQREHDELEGMEAETTPLPELLATDVDLPSPTVHTANYNPLFAQWGMAVVLTDSHTRGDHALMGRALLKRLHTKVEDSVAACLTEARKAQKYRVPAPKRTPAPLPPQAQAAAPPANQTAAPRSPPQRVCQGSGCRNGLSDAYHARRWTLCDACFAQKKPAQKPSQAGPPRGRRNKADADEA